MNEIKTKENNHFYNVSNFENVDVLACKKDFYTFCKTVFEYNRREPYKESWHVKLICDTFHLVFFGKIKRLIINIPPRHFKTFLISMFIAWSLGHYPDSEYIYSSYAKKLAEKSTLAIKDIVLSDIYRYIFPYVRINLSSKAKDLWGTTDNGLVYGVGAGGSITGYGAGRHRDFFGGCMIIDDPHKADLATKELHLNNVISWFNSTMRSRVNNRNTPIIVIMQRLHERDLSGYLMHESGDIWEQLKIPVIFNGKPLLPSVINMDDLIDMERNNPYLFHSQYMQDPIPVGGVLFEQSFWKYYNVLPNLDYKIITGDTAFKTGERNDYSVFQCWGKCKGKMYLIDQIRGKWDSVDLKIMFMAFWEKHFVHDSKTTGGFLKRAYVEDKSSGIGLIQDIEREQRIPIYGIKRHKDKLFRANEILGYIQSGLVFLPKDVTWLVDYINEFNKFDGISDTGHDDQIDATMDAIKILATDEAKASISLGYDPNIV